MHPGVYVRTESQRRALSAANLIDLTGRRFGYLSVVRREGVGSPVQWLVRCRCGKEKTIRGSFLRDGTSKSCGCMKEALISKAVRSHGEAAHDAPTPEYRAWANIVDRCENTNSASYPMYGGRGVCVCARWRSSYEAFLLDMGRRPSPTHSIDRIDNDGNYEPGNCRWATMKEQGRNRRGNRLLSLGGMSMPVAAWAERTGIRHGTLCARLEKGWSVERALTTPVASRAERRK